MGQRLPLALRAAEAACSELQGERRQMAEQIARLGTTAREAHERALCDVCLDQPKSHVFVACMHKCVCTRCAEALGACVGDGVECPICRVRSMSIRRVFE